MSVFEILQEGAEQFDGNELGEFLDALEQVDLQADEDEGEYSVHDDETGLLLAYFHPTPSQGPAGGWINLLATSIA